MIHRGVKLSGIEVTGRRLFTHKALLKTEALLSLLLPTMVLPLLLSALLQK